MDFKELTNRALAQKPDTAAKVGIILCFDPGHTTGWAVFHEGELLESGEINTKTIANCVTNANPLFEEYDPWAVVMEDYRVYKWRKDQHVGSEMLTTRVIGCLETLAVQHLITDIVKQPAHVAKGFCTDKKLKEWGYYQRGERHARDAIRHGCYYILFGAVQKKDQQ